MVDLAFVSLTGSSVFITKDKSAVANYPNLTFSWRHAVLRLELVFNSAFFSLTGTSVLLTKDKSAVANYPNLTFFWRHAVLRFNSLLNSAFFSLTGSAVVLTKDKSAVSCSSYSDDFLASCGAATHFDLELGIFFAYWFFCITY